MILEAIAAVKIANEAIGAVKQLAGHVTSVGQMGRELTKLSDAKESIEKGFKESGDDQLFWALEDIKRKEEQVKTLFIYAGRPGLWEDYQRFLKTRKEIKQKSLEREQNKRLARKKAIKNGLLYTSIGLFTLGIVGGAVAILYWLVSLKGG